MPSAIGLAGMGTVPGLVGWHAVNVTDGPVGAALASAIRGAQANSIATGSLQRAVLGRLGGSDAQGEASPAGGASGSASSVDAASDLHRRQAQRLDDVPPAGRTDARVDGSAFHWRAADTVQAQPIQALRQQVSTALDILQDRVQGGRSVHQDARTAPLAVGYFQQDQDLTPDAALAVSLAAAASRAPRSATLADALGHMLSLSASTTPAMRSALRQADDGGVSEDIEAGPVVDADASAVTHRTLDRALRLLVEQQTPGAADRPEPIREISAAFAPARIAPFGDGVRIGIARHWSGSIASVQTASSFAMTVAPSDASDHFLRNMLHQLSHAGQGTSAAVDRHTGEDKALSEGNLVQMLDPAFVAEAAHASIDIRDGRERAERTARLDPTSRQSGEASARPGTAERSEAAALSAAGEVSAAASISALFSRLLSLADSDAAVVQALSRRLHQGSMLAAASPVLAQYAVGDDPQRLALPGTDGGGQYVMLADSPSFHVDIWADPTGGLCADTEVKWAITGYGASNDPAPASSQASTPTAAQAEAEAETLAQTPTAPSWLQIRRVVHVGRDDADNPRDTRLAPVALTYGVSHLVCEIAHRMTFHAESGRLA